ncbi:hypothetical protein [Lacinutrix mariniflava]|uniref:hypothetical protein n=1 Tax=Lacinutrix mariniflava TaxID=342955 RepID=UPI0006E12449|nr:hypothetical protein [Lacinutrix mariniflava]
MKITTILFLLATIISCQTKRNDKTKITVAKVNSIKANSPFLTKRTDINFLLENLPSIDFPYSSKSIISKVKYYDTIGGFFIDTTFTKIGIQKLSTYIDIENSIQIYEGDTLSIDFFTQKTNTVIKDDITFAYKNNNDFNYNIDSQILFPFFKKELEKVNLIGSYSQYFGENDIAGVFFILTSFNKAGKQIDYLIIFNRFSWENGLEIDFEIKKDFSIQLDRKEIEYFDGDLEKELDPPRVKRKLENYILNDNGIFEKVIK